MRRVTTSGFNAWSIVFFLFFFAFSYIPFTTALEERAWLFYFFNAGILGCALIILLRYFRADKFEVSITIVDALIALFLFISVLSVALNDLHAGGNVPIQFLGTLTLYYVAIKLLNDAIDYTLLLVLISTTVVLQIALGISQIYLVPVFSEYAMLEFKGTMGHSGLFAVYIGSLSIYILHYLGKWINNRTVRTVSISIVIAVVVCITLITKSRTTLLCLLAVGTYCLIRRAGVSHGSRWLFPMLPIPLVLFFFLKMDSSLGRLLILKIGLLNWLRKPIFGFGYGSFGVEYLKWQSNYFSHGGTKKEKYLADTVYVAFSEPFQILFETGLSGLLVCVALSLVVLTARCGVQENRLAFDSVKAVLIFIFLSSIISFTFHSTAILFVATICLAALQNYGDFRYKMVIQISKVTTRILAFFCSLILLILMCVSISLLLTYIEWHSVRKSDISKAKLQWIYENLHTRLKYDPSFITEYATRFEDLGNFEKSIKVLERMNEFDTRIGSYVKLGDLYEVSGDLQRANINFSIAANMCPSRFHPRFRLIKLKLVQGDTVGFIRSANEFIIADEKISAPETYMMKREIAKLRTEVLRAYDR